MSTRAGLLALAEAWEAQAQREKGLRDRWPTGGDTWLAPLVAGSSMSLERCARQLRQLVTSNDTRETQP